MTLKNSQSQGRRPPRIGRMVRIGPARHIEWYIRMRRPRRVGKMIDVEYEKVLRANRKEEDGSESKSQN